MKRIAFLLFVIMMTFSANSYAGERSKIAVSSEGTEEMASISAKAARCPFFLIFDERGKLMEAVENPFKNASKGAGVSVVDYLVQKGVTILIAETFGAKLTKALEENEIAYYELHGGVSEAVNKVINIK